MSVAAPLTSRGRLTGVLGLLLLAGGVAARYPLTAALGLLLLMLVAVEAVAVARARLPSVHRTIEPPVVTRGEDARGTVRVTGRLRRGLVRTDAADRIASTVVPIDLVRSGRAEAVEATYPIPTTHRGLHLVGPVELRRQGPFGLAAASVRAGEAAEIRVLPRRIPLEAMMPGHRRELTAAGDVLESGGTDLVDLREYTMGDDLRRLHWATSARTGRLMVREDADPSEPHVSVLLDDRAEAYPDDREFEDAVELTAALCRLVSTRGHWLRLAFTSGREPVAVEGRRGGAGTVESGEIAWLLSEIAPVDQGVARWHCGPDLDVAVAVTGSARDLGTVRTALEPALTRVACVVDADAVVSATSTEDMTILCGPGAEALAGAWDRAAWT